MVRRRRNSGEALLVGLAATVFAHAIALTTIEAFDLGVFAAGASAASARTGAPDAARAVALETSCDADALLRASARAGWCATPFVEDSRACLDDVEARLYTDFVLCHIDTLEPVPELVQLPTPEQIEKLPQIEAEKLLEPLTPEEMKAYEQKRQEVAMAAPPPPPAAPPPPPQQRPADVQVIETVKPTEEQAPDEARFLAEYDSKVDQQKVARGSKFEEIATRPEAEELKAKKDPAPANQPDPPKDEIGNKPDAPVAPGALSMRAPGHPNPAAMTQDKKIAGARNGGDAPPGDGIAPKKGNAAFSQEETRATETARGQGGAGGGTPRAPNLRPDDEVLERMVGGGSVDHVADVEEGDENQFNTKRWVYASFFNRLKRQVAQNWDPVAVWRREDPEGKHHGYKSRLTQLRVSLDAGGKIQKILVVTPSGVTALDEEAIRSFKAAEPFPNPPQALVDRDGFITFDFGFHFSINHQKTSWKVYRSM